MEHSAKNDITVVLTELEGNGTPAMTAVERLSLESTQPMAPMLDAVAEPAAAVAV